MTATDVANLLSTVQWSEDAYYLKEFIHKYKLPQVGKVIKGQYQCLGVSSLSSPSLSSNVLLASTGKQKRVIAQCVKFKDGKPGKVIPVGPKLAIPENYEGFFEILSENGQSVRCMETVAELARQFPDSVLVRENCKAFVSKSDSIDTLQDKSRLINSGETLILVGEVLGVKGKRFLRCFDNDGNNIYLPHDQKGKFSAIAKEENISGVHNIRNLQKKRLPLMVRLTSGSSPVGLKSGQQFLPELRLLERLDDEVIVVLPLTKEPSIVPLPVDTMLKLQPSLNLEYVQSMNEMSHLVERAVRQMAELANRILVLETSSATDHEKQESAKKLETKRNGNSKSQTSRPNSSSVYGPIGVHQAPTDYDEIDQIYDYVRGFAPLPKSAKGWQYIADKTVEQQQRADYSNKEAIYQKLSIYPQNDAENKPPEPPPIETIPGKKPEASPIESTPPVTPHFSPTWGNPAQVMAPLGPNGQMIGIVPPPHLVIEHPSSIEQTNGDEYTTKPKKIKKRQRPKTVAVTAADITKEKPKIMTTTTPMSTGRADPDNATPTNRYVKSNHKQNSNKHKFFRSKHKEKTGDHPVPLEDSASTTLIHRRHGNEGQKHPSFFNLRYKSLTNLAQQAYNTLDSSDSGGKTSFDSSGSRQVPEKRSRQMTRPKSLTNLVWDLHSGGDAGMMQRSNSKPSLLINRGPGGVNVSATHQGSRGVGRKMGSNKIDTLYL